MNRLPPLKSLQAFRHAAELGSFKAAAEQMHVTQAAISQQIKTLEAHLGMQLFHRGIREIELTSEGQLLLPYISRGFSALEQGVTQLIDDPHPERLTLSTVPSFASRWLVPRLGQFQEQVPEMNIRLTPGLKLESFEDGELDLTIRYGEGNYPGLKSELLFTDSLIPVCHPLLINQQQPITEQLAKLPLLADSGPDVSQVWPEFISLIGLPAEQNNTRLAATDSNMLVDALLAGQGLSILRFSVVYELIERGQLTCPLHHPLRTSYRYYLVAPEHHFKRPKVRQFTDWIRHEIKEIERSWECFKASASE